ncbi:Uncharacterized protein dnm_082680 [Desulfonema magnum]|uniref:Uncharacterized protein n=1 Tax=Desulfonema magnum TaxID=45655 RepID=A0A975BVC9_9BACT|nr:Uncharacterized protein dnm_082680 [Desulfonema magnum]
MLYAIPEHLSVFTENIFITGKNRVFYEHFLFNILGTKAIFINFCAVTRKT